MQQKVLIVDDDRIVADTLAMVLRKRGFDCRVTYSGAEALALSKEFCPEFLVGDISLADMNGLEVVSTITELCPGCRVLLLIGRYYNLGVARQWVRSQRVPARILTKPLAPALLLREMEALGRAGASAGSDPH